MSRRARITGTGPTPEDIATARESLAKLGGREIQAFYTVGYLGATIESLADPDNAATADADLRRARALLAAYYDEDQQ